MFRSWIARLTALLGVHHWGKHIHYHFNLSDSGMHAYQCDRFGKIRSAQVPIQ